jgi:hypothetical protein
MVSLKLLVAKWVKMLMIIVFLCGQETAMSGADKRG